MTEQQAPRRSPSPIERLAASRVGGWYFVNLASRVDPWILRHTAARLSTVPWQPMLLLEHVGAKSGARRETALVYGTEGDTILLVASMGGSPRNPAWYHNLKANPECRIIARGRSGAYRAHELQGAERERAWAIANDVYTGYDVYQARTGGRVIPVLALEPVAG